MGLGGIRQVQWVEEQSEVVMARSGEPAGVSFSPGPSLIPNFIAFLKSA